MIAAVSEIVARRCFVHTTYARETAEEIVAALTPFLNPPPDAEYVPMNVKVQRLQAADSELLDGFILSRPWGLMIRTADKKIVETRYCANAEDLQVNWLYERLRSSKAKLNCFKLIQMDPDAAGTVVWKWVAVTPTELRAMIEAVLPEVKEDAPSSE